MKEIYDDFGNAWFEGCACGHKHPNKGFFNPEPSEVCDGPCALHQYHEKAA